MLCKCKCTLTSDANPKGKSNGRYMYNINLKFRCLFVQKKNKDNSTVHMQRGAKKIKFPACVAGVFQGRGKEKCKGGVKGREGNHPFQTASGRPSCLRATRGERKGKIALKVPSPLAPRAFLHFTVTQKKKKTLLAVYFPSFSLA